MCVSDVECEKLTILHEGLHFSAIRLLSTLDILDVLSSGLLGDRREYDWNGGNERFVW